MTQGTALLCNSEMSRLRRVFLSLLVITSMLPCLAPGADRSDGGRGEFLKVPGAKDCVFDEVRQRLYVTTGKQLVVIDTKERKVVESIDLPGNVCACDISLDCKYLAVAPMGGHFIYWIELEDLNINQIKFTADSMESGVYDLCVGSDNSVLFSMTFAGSGSVKLRRFVPATGSVQDVGGVNMDSIVTASGDRRYAAIAEGNISSGPLKVYDFTTQKLKSVASLDCFHYEMACARDARMFARPDRKGCDMYDENGQKLGCLDGAPVICAAFHPKKDRLYVMRHGQACIQEYDCTDNTMVRTYPLSAALDITGDVNNQIVGQIIPIGPDSAVAQFRHVSSVYYRTFRSGRIKVSQDGEKLFALIPTGVYMIATKSAGTPKESTKKKRHINVIDSRPSKGK